MVGEAVNRTGHGREDIQRTKYTTGRSCQVNGINENINNFWHIGYLTDIKGTA